MRPVTPIPNGCSMTLFSCHFTFAGPEKNEIQRVKSDRKFSIYNMGKQNSGPQKYSLRNHKSNMALRQSSGTSKESELMSLCSYKQVDNFSQLSSVIGPNTQKRQSSKKEGQWRTSKDHQARISSGGLSYSKTNQENIEHVNNASKNQNITNTNVFTDEITLNQLSGYHSKQRETAHTNFNYNYLTMTQRRVHTEENKNQQALFSPTQMENRATNNVYRSQNINTNSAYVYKVSTINSAILPRNSVKIQQREPLPSNCNIPRSPALKKSTYLEAKPSISSMERTQGKIDSRNPISSRQMLVAPLSIRMIQPQANHFRKISSPRFSYPKKFNTLIDLNCKNVDSSGGEHTSSNHVSILAREDSINRSNPDSNGGQFAKVIKLMTLKSLPLNQNIWTSLTKKNLP